MRQGGKRCKVGAGGARPPAAGRPDRRAAGNARPVGRRAAASDRAVSNPRLGAFPIASPTPAHSPRARAATARPPAALRPGRDLSPAPEPGPWTGPLAATASGLRHGRVRSPRARATTGTERYPRGVLVSLETEPRRGGGGETSATFGPLVKPRCRSRERIKGKARVKAKAKTRSKEKPRWGPLSLSLPLGIRGWNKWGPGAGRLVNCLSLALLASEQDSLVIPKFPKCMRNCTASI